jgi:acylphosphatase
MTEQNYRIRIKHGEVEIEAEGDKEFVEKHIEELKKEMPKIAKELLPKEKIVTT